MELNGTKTQKNLLAAFAGESQAAVKYTFFAAKARKDGYEQIARIFEETASNERQHAKIWFRLLNDGIRDTKDNLKEKTTNGQRCMTLLPKRPKRRA